MKPRTISNYSHAGSAFPAHGYFLLVSCTLVCALMLGTGLILGFTHLATFITLPFAVAAAAFVLFHTRGRYDVLHPIRVFGFIWCFCLALASFRLNTVISVWGPSMWTYVIMALLWFIGGFLMMNHFLPRHRRDPSGQAAAGFQPASLLPIRAGLVLAGVCLVIGLAAFSYRYWLTGEIPIFSSDIAKAETTFFDPANVWREPEFDTLPNKFVGLFCGFCKYAVFLACIILCQRTRKTRAQTVVAFVLILGGLMGLGSQGGRGFLAEFGVAASVFFHYLRRRIRLKELGITVVLLILFISFAGYYRGLSGNGVVASQAMKTSRLPDGVVWNSFAIGYLTVTRPLETFYRLTQDLPAMRLPSGQYLFYSVHRFMPRQNIEEFATRLYGGELMAPTFLGEFYADFGAPGIFVGCLLIGFAYGYVYWRALRCDSLYWLSAQAIFMALLMYFPHVNFFSQNVTWIWDLMNMAWLIELARMRRKEHVSLRLGPRIPAPVRPNFGPASYRK